MNMELQYKFMNEYSSTESVPGKLQPNLNFEENIQGVDTQIRKNQVPYL